jgi:hypothetical protein
MKSIKSTTKTFISSKNLKNDDIIILPFNDTEDDIDQLIKEMQEEELLAKENQAIALYSEIRQVNEIQLEELSRVA